MTLTPEARTLRAAATRAGLAPVLVLRLGLPEEVLDRLDRLKTKAEASRVVTLVLNDQRAEVRRAIGRIEAQLPELTRRRDADALLECELVLAALRAESRRLDAATEAAQAAWQTDGAIAANLARYLGADAPDTRERPSPRVAPTEA